MLAKLETLWRTASLLTHVAVIALAVCLAIGITGWAHGGAVSNILGALTAACVLWLFVAFVRLRMADPPPASSGPSSGGVRSAPPKPK